MYKFFITSEKIKLLFVAVCMFCILFFGQYNIFDCTTMHVLIIIYVPEELLRRIFYNNYGIIFSSSA